MPKVIVNSRQQSVLDAIVAGAKTATVVKTDTHTTVLDFGSGIQLEVPSLGLAVKDRVQIGTNNEYIVHAATPPVETSTRTGCLQRSGGCSGTCKKRA